MYQVAQPTGLSRTTDPMRSKPLLKTLYVCAGGGPDPATVTTSSRPHTLDNCTFNPAPVNCSNQSAVLQPPGPILNINSGTCPNLGGCSLAVWLGDGLRHPAICPIPSHPPIVIILSLRALYLVRKIMRVHELWSVLAPAARRCTLSGLAAEHFDRSDDEAGPLFTVGFNASAWMHSVLNVFSWRRAGTGQSHEMQAIFCRLSAISRMLLHPYFIFDGPDCPQVRRGPDPISSGAPLLLVQRFQELLTAFGFGWHV
ncbi:hypothetical protein EDC04DRAFT_2598703, partial [Pisolithus marmoratus]